MSWGSTGCIFRDRATAMLTCTLAFSVASAGNSRCTHEHWSLMFAISNSDGFRPASFMVALNRGSWVLGEQAATTIRSSRFSCMVSWILCWVSSEQVNMFSPA